MNLTSALGLLIRGPIALIVSSSMAQGAAAPMNTYSPRCRLLFLEEQNAFQKYSNLAIFNDEQQLGRKLSPALDLSFGTSVPVVRSLEKEGLYYSEIAAWFPMLRTEAKEKLQKRWETEKNVAGTKPLLTQWLQNMKVQGSPMGEQIWQASSLEQRLALFLRQENPFDLVSIPDRSFLFESDILNFNDITVGPQTPAFVTVGDDLGSYEVRLTRGVVDRLQFHHLRDQVEQFLEGKIGHQHLFHAWPSEIGLRKEIAPYYIELLDSTTWYLYWRQMNRNPEDVSSVMTHPFLGVYTKASLNRLEQAFVKDEPKKFRDKYRMVGSRNFPASKDIPEQAEGLVPDWELRSGNKGIKREFMENMLIARLSTGDYSGLRAFSSYHFNPSASAKDLLQPWINNGISESDILVVEAFQNTHPKMRWSAHGKANNHTRNRIMSPLLPWQNRLALQFKQTIFDQAQREYAVGLVRVAQKYQNALAQAQKPLRDIRQGAIDELESLIYQFAQTVRLDLDFERYLKPVPVQVPNIQLAQSDGPLDINKIDLGIEYSFRMPFEMTPKTQAEAAQHIQGIAEGFAKNEGESSIEKAGDEGHGHGIAVKFKAVDRNQQAWRFEWDGIQRNYDSNGKVTNAWGGHIEVVTPKFSPQSIEGSIGDLFQTARERALVPRRSAGGAHVNFDLGPLMEKFPAEEGTRRLLNFMSYFESTEPVILFMWQHPLRRHAAYPVKVSADAARKIFDFAGDWKQLGKLLYDIKYFNPYKGRKPKYVPLNLTSLMTPIVPDNYIEKTLDIRNPKQEWFPNFNKVHGRGEARFFDAPLDENMAALQIKYFRALLNKGLNSPQKILLVQRYNESDVGQWRENVDAWIGAVNAHLMELGLNPEEFRTLIWDSWMNQKNHEVSPKKLEEFTDFEPSKAIR